MSKNLIKAKVRSDGTINNDELHKAINQLKYENESEHERNILVITQVDDYKSPWKDKDATKVNDLEYTFLNSYDDEISDSSKHVEASKEPIKYNNVRNASAGTTSVDPDPFCTLCQISSTIVNSAVIGVRIIGQGGRGIT